MTKKLDKNSIKVQQARTQALVHAANFTIGIAGVTRDLYIVTTAECVTYQLRKNNLVYWVDGNWTFKRRPDGCGWVKGNNKEVWL